MTTRQHSAAAPPIPDRTALRAELDATRTAFHALLATLSDADLARPGSETDWTVKEELWHVAYAVGFMRGGITRALRGAGRIAPPIPPGVRDWISLRLVRYQARRASRQDLARFYDRQHARLLATLAQTQPADWTRRVQLLGEEPRPLEALFRRPITHFAEHAAQIRQSVKLET
jgi:hypothetical protein